MENSLILVTGGARSGKSRFGESLLANTQGRVLYIATAQAFDDEMKDRIAKHRAQRGENWITYEGYQKVSQGLLAYRENIEAIFLDCITLLVTNLMLDYDVDWDNLPLREVDRIEEAIFQEIKDLVRSLKSLGLPTVLITNEIGLGLVPEYRMARIFRDIAGRINQYLGQEADQVYFVVCGIANQIK